MKDKTQLHPSHRATPYDIQPRRPLHPPAAIATFAGAAVRAEPSAVPSRLKQFGYGLFKAASLAPAIFPHPLTYGLAIASAAESLYHARNGDKADMLAAFALLGSGISGAAAQVGYKYIGENFVMSNATNDAPMIDCYSDRAIRAETPALPINGSTHYPYCDLQTGDVGFAPINTFDNETVGILPTEAALRNDCPLAFEACAQGRNSSNSTSLTAQPSATSIAPTSTHTVYVLDTDSISTSLDDEASALETMTEATSTKFSTIYETSPVSVIMSLADNKTAVIEATSRQFSTIYETNTVYISTHLAANKTTIIDPTSSEIISFTTVEGSGESAFIDTPEETSSRVMVMPSSTKSSLMRTPLITPSYTGANGASVLPTVRSSTNQTSVFTRSMNTPSTSADTTTAFKTTPLPSGVSASSPSAITSIIAPATSASAIAAISASSKEQALATIVPTPPEVLNAAPPDFIIAPLTYFMGGLGIGIALGTIGGTISYLTYCLSKDNKVHVEPATRINVSYALEMVGVNRTALARYENEVLPELLALTAV